MPSDPRLASVLTAMARPIAEFRTLIHDALAQAESFVVAESADPMTRALRAGAELGPFTAGRIDAGRFATLFPAVPSVGPAALDALAHAIVTLGAVIDRGDSAFVVDLPGWGRLGAAVDRALAELGRAFGAVMLTEAVRGGRYDPATHGTLLAPLEFRAWSKSARRFAPPLIVTLEGSDLHPGALSDYADGREKIVLVVRGAAAPAPLARCITPGILVLQTTDGTGLDRIASFDGPAIAAVMPEGSAVFLHDPLAGREPWQRLTVRTLGELPKRSVGGMSAWHMTEDRTLLGDLARTPFAIPTTGGVPAHALGADDALDRVAAWLMEAPQ